MSCSTIHINLLCIQYSTIHRSFHRNQHNPNGTIDNIFVTANTVVLCIAYIILVLAVDFAHATYVHCRIFFAANFLCDFGLFCCTMGTYVSAPGKVVSGKKWQGAIPIYTYEMLAPHTNWIMGSTHDHTHWINIFKIVSSNLIISHTFNFPLLKYLPVKTQKNPTPTIGANIVFSLQIITFPWLFFNSDSIKHPKMAFPIIFYRLYFCFAYNYYDRKIVEIYENSIENIIWIKIGLNILL